MATYAPIGSMSVKFDGHELNSLIQVPDGFTPFDGGDMNPVVLDKPQHTGTQFIYTKIGAKTIKMPFLMWDNIPDNYDRLEEILNVSEPKPLVFGILPNRVFYAIPSGTLDFDETNSEGGGVISWYIPDGVGHLSVLEKQVFTLNEEENVLEATLVNNGTGWADVDFEITMNHENGYVGIVSQYGAIELGDINELDATELTKTVTITHNAGGDFSNWTNGTVLGENPNKKAVTTMSSSPAYGGWLGYFDGPLTPTAAGTWYGAIKEYIIEDPDITDWYIWARAWFETGLIQQSGTWGLSVVDSNNLLIAGMILEKNQVNSNMAHIYFQQGVAGGAGTNNVQYIERWTPSYWIPPNPYGAQSRDTNRNMFDLSKNGDNVTYFYNGKYYPHKMPAAVAARKAHKIQFFKGQYGGRPAGNRIVDRMMLSDLSFRKLNVPYLRDDPNRYIAGSVIFIDGVEERPYINGVLRLDDEVVGSKYFKIPPGETKVQIVYSDFSTPAPDAFAKVREVYL